MACRGWRHFLTERRRDCAASGDHTRVALKIGCARASRARSRSKSKARVQGQREPAKTEEWQEVESERSAKKGAKDAVKGGKETHNGKTLTVQAKQVESQAFVWPHACDFAKAMWLLSPGSSPPTTA